jgi:aminopeptidase-like protein
VKVKGPKIFVIAIVVIFLGSSIISCGNPAHSQNMSLLDGSLVEQIDISRIYNITDDLSSFRTRFTGTLECSLAANYILSMINNTFNITDCWQEFWEYNGSISSNVVARVNGTNIKEEIIVICAHYDSISYDGDAPGANDNGVAVALCMEILRIVHELNTLNRTLIFVTFAGEEEAFIGSQAWINEHKGDLSKIVAVINLDMIGYGDRLSIIKNEQSDWLADLIISVSSPVDITLSKSNSPYPESARFDHDTFWLTRVPTVTLFEAGSIYPYYHTSKDTIDRISFSLVEKCAQITLLSVFYLGTVNFQHNWGNLAVLICIIWGIAVIIPLLVYKKFQRSFIVLSAEQTT